MADSTVIVLSETQKALKAHAGVAALVGSKVHVAPLAKPEYPYVLITCESQPFAADTFSGMEHRLRVQAFARENRPGTVLAIRAAVFEALDRKEASLSVPGLVLLQHDGMSTYFPEDDGRTYQSLIEFKALVN